MKNLLKILLLCTISLSAWGTYPVSTSGSFGIVPQWMTGTSYNIDDLVWEQEKFYKALTNHISGVFATDLANNEWIEMSEQADLQMAYNNSTQPQIVVDTVVDGVQIRDNAVPIAASLFAVQNNAGTTDYLDITAALVSVTPPLALPSLTASTPLKLDGSNNVISADIDLTTDVSGILPIANGGTNSSTALNNDRLLHSAGGAIVERAAMTNGQLPIGSTGASPVNAVITGTANRVTVTNGAGSITLNGPQDIHTGASPTFVGATFSGLTANQFVVTNGSSALASQASISLTTDISGILPVANGGTNSSTALSNSLVMESVGGAIVESTTTSTELDLLNSRTYIPDAVGVDNRVAVYDGVNSMDSSANLTFDGTSLDLTGSLNILTQNDLRLQDTTGGDYVALQANTATTTHTLTLPAAQGANNTFLKNDGSGGLTWESTIALSSVVQNVDYTILDGDGYTNIYIEDTTIDRTWTLPTLADNQNRKICFHNISTQKGMVTIDGEGAEDIGDAYTSIDLDFKEATMCLVGTTNTWIIESENITAPQKEYAPTITGTNWTTTLSVFTPFRTMSGEWRTHLIVAGTVSIAATTVNLTVVGVTFLSAGSINQNISMRANNIGDQGFTNPGVSIMSLDGTSSTSWGASGIVKLNAKPTFVE